MTETADIVVVGGGCIGTSIALHLAEKCAGRILLLEQKDLANGASGKGLGTICTHHTHPTLAKLAYQSLQRFQHFSERYDGHESGFHPCGYYILVGETDVETLSSLVNQHQSFGINTDLVDPQQVKAAVPTININDIAAAAYEPDSGYGDSLQTTRAFAKRAIELGVELRTHTPVTAIRLDIEGRIDAVITPQGAIATRTVIDCVGAWAGQFTAAVDLPFPVTPAVEHVVGVERPDSSLTAPPVPHPVISDMVNLCYLRSDAQHPYTRVSNSDPRYHTQFCLDTADQFQGQLFPDICETLHQKLLHRIPSLAASSGIQAYSGMWGVTPDYQPIIDRLEHVPGLYCAIGFSGHGYQLSPIIGDLMSRFIMGKSDSRLESLKLFRYSRFQENDLVKSPLNYRNPK